jgi:hypothetical protein
MIGTVLHDEVAGVIRDHMTVFHPNEVAEVTQ